MLVRRAGTAALVFLRLLNTVAIIGLIVSLVTFAIYRPCHGRSELHFTKVLVAELVGVAKEAIDEDPTCPTVDRLVARQLLRKHPRDAWGTPLVLRCPSEHDQDPVDVVSWGPDKKPDTADDINSWEL